MAVTYAFTYNVKNYGAKGDGLTDDYGAITVAILAAQQGSHDGSGMLYFPSSTGGYVFSQPLVLNYVGILGDGPGSVLMPQLSPTLPFGSGYAIDLGTPVDNIGRQPILENFTLKSPVNPVSLSLQTVTPPYGFSPTVGNGIQIEGQAKAFLNNVVVEGFDKGFVYANTLGHIFMDQCVATNNFYGIWVENSTGNYVIRDSDIASNLFANIGVHPHSGVNGMDIINSRVGHAPFGLFQEPYPANVGTGFDALRLSNASFEQIGNGAIYAEIAATTTIDGRTSGAFLVTAPDFSWNTIAYVPSANTPTMSVSGHYYLGKPRNYCVQVGHVQSINRFEGDNAPFVPVAPSPGFSNSYVYHFYSINSWIEIRDDFVHLENVLVDNYGGSSVYGYELSAGNTDLFPGTYQANMVGTSSTLGFASLPILLSDPVPGLTFPPSGGGVGYVGVATSSNRLYVNYNDHWYYASLTMG